MADYYRIRRAIRSVCLLRPDLALRAASYACVPTAIRESRLAFRQPDLTNVVCDLPPEK